jgi:hypothetical protein
MIVFYGLLAMWGCGLALMTYLVRPLLAREPD